MTAPRSLWRHRGFRQLWVAETASHVGTQVVGVALPVVAVAVLGASPLEMGVLTALETAAFLLIALPAGAWVDRWRRQRVLVRADVVRALALLTIPVAYLLDALTLGQLFVVAAVVGTATVFFDVAYQSYLPSLVDRSQLTDGNGKLEISRAVAQVAGPGLAGVLLRVVAAPLLIVVTAVGYLLSAAAVGRIHHGDVVPARSSRRRLRVEVREGLAFVVGHPLLRRIVACTGTGNLFGAITGTLLAIYVLRTLGLSESTLGLVLSAGAAGGLLGAGTAAPFARWVGDGRTIPLSAVAFGLAASLTPLASLAEGTVRLALLVGGSIAGSWAVVVYNVVQVSFRQRLCPPGLLGRMNASVRFLVFGTMPVGGLLGGVLGTAVGVVPALWVAVAGQLLAALPVLLSPLAGMRDLPDEWDAGPVQESSAASPGSPPA
ncbi:MFS transporter [Modestobacter sp. Leaf380]|uniref:MFS transporter n=1 Tax=Modestobacter sp. Leaf380 TaxID=1736356 RepID=UPI0006F782B2|nr:MFS transporter [Modestobacter sp. Leaf380]KQS69848.1 MFS transporter [Modestobacter sp. Leaf380]